MKNKYRKQQQNMIILVSEDALEVRLEKEETKKGSESSRIDLRATVAYARS